MDSNIDDEMNGLSDESNSSIEDSGSPCGVTSTSKTVAEDNKSLENAFESINIGNPGSSRPTSTSKTVVEDNKSLDEQRIELKNLKRQQQIDALKDKRKVIDMEISFKEKMIGYHKKKDEEKLKAKKTIEKKKKHLHNLNINNKSKELMKKIVNEE
ncbi:hypothetical protein FO519_010089 [Halicephalobus sp. NKZ332]|nr:hypothetical protein FO519_010089 [Halicephalobus sp. NKZ332]